MQRRTFLLSAGIASTAAATGIGFWRWQEIDAGTRDVGRALGHRLRDQPLSSWPAPSAHYTTDVLIAGSGVAGLTTAWRLAREGFTHFVLVEGPEPHGNAASGRLHALRRCRRASRRTCARCSRTSA